MLEPVGPRKICCRFVTIVCSAPSRVVFFCKTGVQYRGTSFCTLGYLCLSCLTTTKHSFAFSWLQWMKNTPHGPAQSWKLSFIVCFDSYWLYTSMTKFDVRFCWVDPHVDIDGWRESSCFYYYCSDGISVAVLGSSLFDTCYFRLSLIRMGLELIHLQLCWKQPKCTRALQTLLIISTIFIQMVAAATINFSLAWVRLLIEGGFY